MDQETDWLSWQLHLAGAHRPPLDQRPEGTEHLPRTKGWPGRDHCDELLFTEAER